MEYFYKSEDGTEVCEKTHEWINFENAMREFFSTTHVSKVNMAMELLFDTLAKMYKHISIT